MVIVPKRIKRLTRRGIREVFEQASQYEAKGRNIIHMEVGRPDFDTPQPIKEAAVKAIQAGFVHYTSDYGLQELKHEVARKLALENGLKYDPQNEILITVGAVEAISLSIMALLEAGDEVLVPEPAFPSYANLVILAGGEPIAVPLSEEEGFQINNDDLKKRISPRTRMLVINSPHNPTGVVYSRETLAALARIAEKHNLIVLSDECYEDIIYEKKHISFASLPRMQGRTITINSTSKSFSMTGWRVGFAAADAGLIDLLIKVHQDLVICAPSFCQKGSIVAYRDKKELIRPMLEEYKKRRQLVMDYLDDMVTLSYVRPEGGFYVFPSVKRLGVTDREFCDYILDKAGVALVPGSAFGTGGEGYFRLAFTCSYQELEQGMQALGTAVAGFEPET